MTELIDLLLRTLPILLGGGAVQVVLFLVKRKSEMRTADVAARKGDVDADAVVVASAEKSLLLSDQARDRAVKRAEQLNADLTHAEAELAEVLVESRALRVDMAAAQRQLAAAQRQLDGALQEIATLRAQLAEEHRA